MLRARPELIAPLGEALAAYAADGGTGDELTTDARFATIRYVVAAAYYLDERVRTALGYDPERVVPVRALDFPEYLEEGLLDHLVGSS